MLAEDMARTCAQHLYTSRGEDTPDHQVKIFHSLVLQEKLCLAVRWIMEREKGGVFLPGKIFSKTGKPVLEVLCSKYPGDCPMKASRFEAYGGKPTAFVLVYITDKTVDFVAQQL